MQIALFAALAAAAALVLYLYRKFWLLLSGD